MVSLDNYYNKVPVSIDRSHPLGNRILKLLNEVIARLPDEEQFEIKGEIKFFTREQAIKFWDKINSKVGISTDFKPPNIDGNCTFTIAKKVEDSLFIITIIVDSLESKSDDYIKGLIAHEISEMSYGWRALQSEKENLEKLKPKAKQVRINQITKQDARVGSTDHEEHENNVDGEARRLGFSKEIDELNSLKTNGIFGNEEVFALDGQ